MKQGMMTKRVTLPAGLWTEVPAHGEDFCLTECAGPIDVEFFGMDRESLGIGEGLEVGDAGGPGAPFRFVSIYSATEQAVRFISSTKGWRVARLAGNVSAVIVSPTILTELAGVAVGAGLSVQIAAADENRQEIVIANPDTHTGKIYLRSNNTAAPSALFLYPGEKGVFKLSDAVFCYNPEAGSVTPLVSELK
jgi:hypothetical protein